ncbi:MAG: hypothetical protein EU547_06950 [Promethearchaeota archaeon]|nr:MAG: hypothetical protein EU547_06950 [Candidatus Lokiarchaeota archaeon]
MEKANYEAANGTVKFVYVESTDIDISTTLSKVDFDVVEFEGGEPIENALVKVYNATNSPTTSETVAELKVDAGGLARYYGFNNETGDWGNHTILIEFYEQTYDFDVNGETYSRDEGFNFTFDTYCSYNVEVRLNIENLQTNLTLISLDPSNLQTDVYWNDSINILFNFTITINETTELSSPDNIKMRFYDEGFTPYGPSVDLKVYENPSEKGIFNVTFNTAEKTLKGGSNYYIVISAQKTGYSPPESISKYLKLQRVPTNLTIYDYESKEQLGENKIESYYGELTNVSLKYFNTQDNIELSPDTFIFNWDDYDAGNIDPDPINDGFYYFTVNSSKVSYTGTYTIDITVEKEDYETINDVIEIEIIIRPTVIEGGKNIIAEGGKNIIDFPEIYIHEAINFTFEYNDSLTHERLSGAQEAYYEWSTKGDSESVREDLIETEDKLYILDFDTENRDVGEYSLYIQIEKDNYESRWAYLTLKIKKRIIETENLPSKQENVVQGNTLKIQITLTDPTNGSQLITNANVSLEVQGTKYTLNMIQEGIYELSFPTSGVNALFTSANLPATITIEKENYETITYDFSIVVGMTEIFPGIPMFYFIMIAGAIGAVVGALGIYRYVQVARIPEFVKRADKIKKSIKKGKSISDKNLYQSKEKFIAKWYGDDWEEVGLSIEDSLRSGKKGEKSFKGGAK